MIFLMALPVHTRDLPPVGAGEEYETNPEALRVYDPNRDADIIRWRARCFLAAGLEPLHVAALAVRRDVDRELVERMAKQGCSSALILGALL